MLLSNRGDDRGKRSGVGLDGRVLFHELALCSVGGMMEETWRVGGGGGGREEEEEVEVGDGGIDV